jgi:DNA repair exonuclease SbcCD ATPase subunit
MKQVRINKIIINSFKGIASGNFAFNGENTEIVADVMQGKSTIKDAYLWCLGLEIDNFYPCDKNNQLIDGLETRVELTLDIDGIEYKLSRSAKIKYKNKQFDGFKKDIYEFDGVPCTATDYKAKLCDLLGVGDFDTLKYLTVLNHFNEGVHWKDRRALIYSLFVDSQAIDGLKDEPKYDLISKELKKGKSSADISTMLNSENNRLVDSKRKNEILLADKQSELAGFANIDYASVETELASVETEITAEQARIDGLSKEDVVKSLLNKINKLELEHQSLSTADSMKKVSISGKVSSLSMSVALLEQQGTNLEKNLEVFKKDYNQLKVSEFDESKTICPTCHQPLQQEGIDKLKATWQEEKDKKLASLKETTLSIKKNYEQIKEEYADKKTILETANQELADFKPNPRIAELETEIATLQAELDNTEANEIDTSHLDELKSRRNFLIVELGKKDSHEKLKAKIASLYAEQRELVNAEIVLAKKRQQLEQYTLDIISLVNESINSHFDNVKFKLFEELTATASKSIKETLVCLNNGIDYVSQSTGQKANSNCIIVSTLQERLGTRLPIWLDDASILNLKETPKSQCIFLLNEKGKKLDCTRIDEIY